MESRYDRNYFAAASWTRHRSRTVLPFPGHIYHFMTPQYRMACLLIMLDSMK